MKTSKLELLKPTKEDWYPSVKIGSELFVWVTFEQGKNTSRDYLVCVWGNDDFGMEIWTGDKTHATEIFEAIIYEPFVSVQQLKLLGLKTA